MGGKPDSNVIDIFSVETERLLTSSELLEINVTVTLPTESGDYGSI